MIPKELLKENRTCENVDESFAEAWKRVVELGATVSQDPEELEWLGGWLRWRGCSSFLEIGSRRGGSFFLLSLALPPGSRVAALDLPGGPWGSADSAETLTKVGEALKERGYQVSTVLRNSNSPEAVAEIRRLFPNGLDAVFVDGDHSYEGVRADYENYFPLLKPGGCFALHDVWPRHAEPGIEVYAFWVELMRLHVWDFFVARPSSPGIGVIWKEEEQKE